MRSHRDQERDKLIQKLHEHLDGHPEDVTHFMEVITYGLKKYKEGVAKMRDAQASNAFDYILPYLSKERNKKFQKLSIEGKIPLLINAVMYCMPNANEGTESTSMKEMAAEYRKWCLEVDIMNAPNWTSWLKNNNYYEWMEKFVTYDPKK